MNPDIEDSGMADEFGGESQEGQKRQQMVRRGKLILYNRPNNPLLDESVVSVDRYSRFGMSLFPGRNSELQMTAGVTSPEAGDGKTLVAANLAAFFALDAQEDAVLLDMNFRAPKQHDVFGVPPVPGILDGLRNDTITLSRSAVKGLWVLPLGTRQGIRMSFDMVVELREILSTLKRQFRFVVVDLPSALEPAFPAVINSYLDGYFVVVNSGKTKKTDIKKVFTVLHESKIIGFVVNHAHTGMRVSG